MSILETMVKDLAEFAAGLEADWQLAHVAPPEPGVSNPETLGVILVALRECRAELKVLADLIEADLIAVAGKKRFVVEGLGEFEVNKSKSYKNWDNEQLTRVVVARALDERIVDEQTGEYEPREQAVARVLSECARPSWRLTPLRSRGIDESEFCEITEADWSVRLPPRGK